jgi:hydroxymethylpyrimidine/phosphomethylpyrimidine kinase
MTTSSSEPTMPVVITIAGSDSGGGAGIQADLKTFEAHGVFGTTAITSITAQNTVGVRAVHDLPLDIIRAQLDAVFDDFTLGAIKIGMLSSAATVELVADLLMERARGVPIVLDPVMVATSGDRLLRDDAVTAMLERLVPIATIVTPNSDEAAVLAAMPVGTFDDMRRAARTLIELGAHSVLLKGGHIAPRDDGGDGPVLVDLFDDGIRMRELPTPYITTDRTHGTGCTLSSAIAARVALGAAMLDAVVAAQRYVHGAIAAAPPLGRGHGPLRHGWMNAAPC